MWRCGVLDVRCIEHGPMVSFNHLIIIGYWQWVECIITMCRCSLKGIQCDSGKFALNAETMKNTWDPLCEHYSAHPKKKSSGDKSISCFLSLKQMSTVVAPLNYWQQTRINGLLNVPFSSHSVCLCVLVFCLPFFKQIAFIYLLTVRVIYPIQNICNSNKSLWWISSK